MSIELLLIPVGLAAYAALKEHRRTDLCEGCKQTRVVQPELLVRALERLGATDIVIDGQVIAAQSVRGSLRFQLIEGLFLGRVDNGSEEETQRLLADLDSAVGEIVQSDKVEEMRTRAAQLGLRLVGEEVADDGTVQLIFEEAD
jgi:hypothetical protein